MPLESEPLMHVYNAAQRREYYLRTRKLKGRVKGAVVSPSSRAAAIKAEKARKRRAIEARVKALQARLDQLRKVLKVLVDQAQARNGNDSKKSEKKDNTPEKQTAKQKAAAQKASEKYARTHKDKKDQSLSEQAKDLSDKIKSIEERIKKLRAKR